MAVGNFRRSRPRLAAGGGTWPEPTDLASTIPSMKAAWHETQGASRDVLVVGEMPDPEPGPDEVRIRLVASGINPGDLKKRENGFGIGMRFPRVIPQGDGAGVIDRVGDGVPTGRIGERVWCFGAPQCRPRSETDRQ